MTAHHSKKRHSIQNNDGLEVRDSGNSPNAEGRKGGMAADGTDSIVDGHLEGRDGREPNLP